MEREFAWTPEEQEEIKKRVAELTNGQSMERRVIVADVQPDLKILINPDPDDIDHITCCDSDQAYCGADVTEHTKQPDNKKYGNWCIACLIQDLLVAPCGHCVQYAQGPQREEPQEYTLDEEL